MVTFKYEKLVKFTTKDMLTLLLLRRSTPILPRKLRVLASGQVVVSLSLCDLLLGTLVAVIQPSSLSSPASHR